MAAAVTAPENERRPLCVTIRAVVLSRPPATVGDAATTTDAKAATNPRTKTRRTTPPAL
jgi:hypothetical protein